MSRRGLGIAPARRPGTGCRAFSIGIAVAVVVLVIGGNAHLLYVAFGSQPDCVGHVKAGAGGERPATFSAARSSC